MKKIIIAILMTLIVLPMTTKALATNFELNEYMNIYIFYEDEKEIEEEKKWLEELKIDDLELRVESINIKEDVYNKFKDVYNMKKDTLPITVIGSTYYKGYNDSVKKNITKVIESYKGRDYCDLVSKLKNNEDTKDCLKTNKEVYNPVNITPIIIISSIVVLVCGVGIYLVIKRRK